MRIAVLVKQVPRFEEMELGADGRLRRQGVELELNPFCRRAVAKGVELARAGGGECVVVSLGPPAAEDCLREAVAWGADAGVLVSDPAFAGSDTLATARALTAALQRLGRFDLVLCGRNSVDADTGQVGPGVAELCGLPFAGPARELHLQGRRLTLRCELDDGFVTAELDLPAVVSCAERLCPPAKVDPAGRAAVDPARLRRLGAAALGPGPWGEAGSPTRVGRVRVLAIARARRRLEGAVAAQARQAVALLAARGALDAGPAAAGLAPPRTEAGQGAAVAAVAEPGLDACTRELAGAAARLAAAAGGHAVLVGVGDTLEAAVAGSWGAAALLRLPGAAAPEPLAASLADWCAAARPWAVLLPSTALGRELGARCAARLGAGLVGDAVELALEAGRLVAWKPAFGGGLVAAVTCVGEPQMATVRPGVLPLPALLPERPIPASMAPPGSRPARVSSRDRLRDDDVEVLAHAAAVLGVGAAIHPEEYPALDPLRRALGAELACSRKVTDLGWMPRSRQVGITGRSLAPRLFVSLATQGKFNHLVGVRAAGTVLAVNVDPSAPIFEGCDVGIVAPWREAVSALVDALAERSAAVTASPRGVA